MSFFGAPAAAPAAAPKFSFGTPPSNPLVAPSAAAPGGFGFGAGFGAPAPAAAGIGSAGGLFGGGAATAGSPGLGGLSFGAKPAASSLFGQPIPAATPALGGFGASTGALSLSTAAPAVSNVTRTTKFNDAPEMYRSLIEGIEGFIRSQVELSEEMKRRDLGEEIERATSSYEAAAADFTTVQNELSQDARLAQELRSKLEVELIDVSKVTALMESYLSNGSGSSGGTGGNTNGNGTALGRSGKVVAGFPFEYFSKRAEEFNERIGRYKIIMDQIQHQLNSTKDLEQNPSAIVPTLRAQHSSFMTLASHVAALDADLKVLKEDYRALWRRKTSSVQDPFSISADAGQGRRSLEKGVGELAIR